jgi:hypothetical protein
MIGRIKGYRKNYLTKFVKDNRHLIITVRDFDASYWKS